MELIQLVPAQPLCGGESRFSHFVPPADRSPLVPSLCSAVMAVCAHVPVLHPDSTITDLI